MNPKALKAALASRYADARLRFQLWQIKRKCPLTRRALEAMPADQFLYGVNISPHYRYVYIDNPKTGCSSLKSALVELESRERNRQVNCYDDAVFHNPFVSPLSNLLDFGANASLTYLMDNGYRFFTMTRNPYTRLLSAYRDKILNNAKEKAKISAVLGRGSQVEGEISFGEFVDAVIVQSDADMDSHWRPQTTQVHYGLIPYDLIGRFESYQESIGAIFTMLGIPAESIPQPRHLNRSGPREDCRRWYDDEMRRKVYERYRADFEAFGYGCEIPE